MSAANFANQSRRAPNPDTANHGGGVRYTCHMAAMHWAFMDRGDTQAVANQRVSAIAVTQCPGCANGGPMHPSIPYAWYAGAFCGGAQRIPNRAALYGAVQVGDVLIVGGAIQAPMHTMVVVNKRSALRRTWVHIRGFNNVGTLGTGPHLAYDNNDRDIDRARYWHRGAAGDQTFGNGPGNNLFVIPYNTYSARARVIRGQCFGAPMTYRGN
ncbi:MAG: hypothetical protein GY904_13925 [Planctomycetaceae bacterium]|nr:hypothetical protein [Planctomycetaceae bacterium]